MGSTITILPLFTPTLTPDQNLFPKPKMVRQTAVPIIFDIEEGLPPSDDEFIDDWVEYYQFVNNNFKK